jgi:hypothetical protein
MAPEALDERLDFVGPAVRRIRQTIDIHPQRPSRHSWVARVEM